MHNSPYQTKEIKSYKEKYNILANYISAEIAGSLMACEEEIRIIQDIEHGILEEYDSEGVGNACGIVVITKERAGIYMYNDEDNPTYYPFHTYKKAIEEWYGFIKTGKEREVYFPYVGHLGQRPTRLVMAFTFL